MNLRLHCGHTHSFRWRMGRVMPWYWLQLPNTLLKFLYLETDGAGLALH